MYLVKDLYEKHARCLGLKLTAGKAGINKRIQVPEVQRPGLSLAGYLKNQADKRILVLGKAEMEYIRQLEPDVLIKRLEAVLTARVPAVILTRRYLPPKELCIICEQLRIPLFRTSLSTMSLLNQLTLLLADEFAPSISLHGTLVDVGGVGMLIQGDAAVGKSEAALGLIERGHRLVSDDVVIVRKKGLDLAGSGADFTHHQMEIRHIGIINIAHLYGLASVCDEKKIDLVIHLEIWQNNRCYERIVTNEKLITILDVTLPYFLLPVKPGQNNSFLLETIALNHRLKRGHSS